MKLTKISLIFSLLFITSVLFSNQSGKKIIIEVTKGPDFKHEHKFGGIKLKVIPQFAMWIEDVNGNFLKTIYVTHKSATSKWIGGSKLRRPSALPVWSHKRGIKYKDGLYMPTNKDPLPDSETGATPKDSFQKIYMIPDDIKNNEIVLFVEVNKSFDYNNIYKEKLKDDNKYYNDVNGQPSLVYKAVINLTEEKVTELKIVGHGQNMGKNGKIYPSIDFITSAKSILKSITVKIE